MLEDRAITKRLAGKGIVVDARGFASRDHETGLHHNRHRYCDPRSGRFISRDLIGLAGGINPYIHVRNPVIRRDPLGLQATGADARLVSSFTAHGNRPNPRPPG
ncbi:RHS repeat-associated core domain-containing protein [Burkholderia sp. F1]|uniref:RHS repeat-associated core domain-containing protein n=1 Tax=Burkholderia sp. F1 TaxID=3366817 RepID=UPI003D737D48